MVKLSMFKTRFRVVALCLMPFVSIYLFQTQLMDAVNDILVFVFMMGNGGDIPQNKSVGDGFIRVHIYNYARDSFGDNPFQYCKSKCYMTTGTNDYQTSPAVIFVSKYISSSPPSKPPDQVWIFLTAEPPFIHMPSFSKWAGLFNWTMTHRRDSDIWNKYGSFRPLTEVEKSQRKDTHIWTRNSNNKIKIAWAVSNCGVPSDRLRYASLLNQNENITIDVYGKCGKFECSNSKREACMQQFAKNYSFYLSFENALCRDYITEKIFNIYSGYVNMIPITRGTGRLYSLFLPPGSYINTDDFTSEKDLSKFIESVSRNRTKYNQYFLWRNQYTIDNNSPYSFCTLCDRLHTNYTLVYNRIYNDIDAWFRGSEPLSCKKTNMELIPIFLYVICGLIYLAVAVQLFEKRRKFNNTMYIQR